MLFALLGLFLYQHTFLYSHADCACRFGYDRSLAESGWNLRALSRTNSAAIVGSFPGISENIVRFELAPKDYARNGRRAELTDDYIAPLGSEVRYEFSVFIPPEFPSDISNSTVLAQWHTTGAIALKPPVALRYRHNRFDITLNFANTDDAVAANQLQKNIFRAENIAKGVWHRFRFEMKWSKNSDGYLRTWWNGQAVVDYHGQTTYANQSEGPYFKYGLYVYRDLNEALVAYHGPYQRRRLDLVCD